MESEAHAGAASAEEWVVLASFPNRHSAERMLASLGHEFRRTARKGHAVAFVVSGNADSSLKLTRSRALEASGLAAAIIRITASMMVGFHGLVTTLKGAKRTARAAHELGSHVGSDEQRAHEILAQAGSKAAIALVRSNDPGTRKMVAARAADQTSYNWEGSMPLFLSGLDPGSTHDWVRAALSEPL
jgi:hypothetical protein